MHDSLRLYDLSLAMIGQEIEALESEDDDRLMGLCEARMEYMQEAWDKRAGCDPGALLKRLEAIRKAQRILADKTRDVTDAMRVALQNSRRENARLAGYGKVISHRQSALIVSKEG